jgi:hypothetical protein
MNALCACGCGEMTRGGTYRRGHYLNPMRPAEERFWRHVKRSDGCWLWQGGLSTDGYGRIRQPGKRSKVLAHRFSYARHYGPIPDGLWVLHRCDVRACVRPDHLFLGTHADNMRDKVTKGRQPSTRGEKNPRAKLTAGQVLLIRERHRQGESRDALAQAFGVTYETVAMIVRRATWTHLGRSA